MNVKVEVCYVPEACEWHNVRSVPDTYALWERRAYEGWPDCKLVLCPDHYREVFEHICEIERRWGPPRIPS
jgi:hypothetical protein